MLTDMELTLTPRQIKMMKHAIGLDTSNGKVQKNKGVFEAYRNYYSASKPVPEWQRLVAEKLATATPDSDGGIVYRMTDEGANVLSEIFEIKITL
mgnify:FL=1